MDGFEPMPVRYYFLLRISEVHYKLLVPLDKDSQQLGVLD